ncbi:prepilin-type N-terminal cleavage/methylation domain-containing protein [Fortiea contorta]|uniref:prepilin-type N-terminal cleavage/methylation domain-containing protein n=1 Tax=Fortiea contorta TaxID=1892405 RepID=UPI00034B259F|nr:prepilin-type N-terminal cleavage/methylation domain-containing protein [Fortiea contorta]
MSNQSSLLKIYFQLQKLVAKTNSTQGFTIIESLMAIVVITILLVAITPPIFLAVATRVQNQKAEQAMQLAQRQVDEVRVLIEKGNYTNDNLTTILPDGGTGAADAVAAPTSSFTCSPLTSASACEFDVNNDGRTDFFIQKFRTKSATQGGVVVAFNMGVRVYSALANGQSGLETTQASLKFTTEQGSQRKYPLAVIYTPIVRSDIKDSLNKYREFLNPSPSPSSSPSPSP